MSFIMTFLCGTYECLFDLSSVPNTINNPTIIFYSLEMRGLGFFCLHSVCDFDLQSVVFKLVNSINHKPTAQVGSKRQPAVATRHVLSFDSTRLHSDIDQHERDCAKYYYYY